MSSSSPRAPTKSSLLSPVAPKSVQGSAPQPPSEKQRSDHFDETTVRQESASKTKVKKSRDCLKTSTVHAAFLQPKIKKDDKKENQELSKKAPIVFHCRKGSKRKPFPGNMPREHYKKAYEASGLNLADKNTQFWNKIITVEEIERLVVAITVSGQRSKGMKHWEYLQSLGLKITSSHRRGILERAGVGGRKPRKRGKKFLTNHQWLSTDFRTQSLRVDSAMPTSDNSAAAAFKAGAPSTQDPKHEDFPPLFKRRKRTLSKKRETEVLASEQPQKKSKQHPVDVDLSEPIFLEDQKPKTGSNTPTPNASAATVLAATSYFTAEDFEHTKDPMLPVKNLSTLLESRALAAEVVKTGFELDILGQRINKEFEFEKFNLISENPLLMNDYFTLWSIQPEPPEDHSDLLSSADTKAQSFKTDSTISASNNSVATTSTTPQIVQDPKHPNPSSSALLESEAFEIQRTNTEEAFGIFLQEIFGGSGDDEINEHQENHLSQENTLLKEEQEANEYLKKVLGW